MRPEQHIAFRIGAVASLFFSTGCSAAAALLEKRSTESPVPLPSPMWTPQETDMPFATGTPELVPTITPTPFATATERPEPYGIAPDSSIRFDQKIQTVLDIRLGDKQERISFVPNPYILPEEATPGVWEFKSLCLVGTEYGCTYSVDNRTFIFLDSGWFDGKKLAAEPIRSYLEGSYPMRSSQERDARLQEMLGTAITIAQDGQTWDGEVVAALYIPHEHVEAFTQNITDGPLIAGELYPDQQEAIAQGVVFVEFCGWDKTLSDHEQYTGSRYMLVLAPRVSVQEVPSKP